MSRTVRPVALVATLLASLLLLAACGGDDKGSDDSAAYKKQAKAVVLSIRATGDKLGDVLSNASNTNDAELTQQLEAVQDLITSDQADIDALEPPDDTAKKLVATLKTAYAAVVTDVGKLTDAATANDPTGAKTATEQLVKDSPAVKTANNALGVSVGVPPRTETDTPTSTTSADAPDTTDTTGTSVGDDGGTDFVTAADAVTTRIAELGNKIESIIKGASEKDDATLAQELADAEDEAQGAITDLKALQPPTPEYEQMVSDLDAAMQEIDGDLGSLSSSVGAHDVEGSKAGTRKLLKDAPAVAKANNALADATRTS